MLNPDRLDKSWIGQHIPHQGAMCLLDAVELWDENFIQCSANSHRDNENPLRSHQRLSAVCGIEYAAQAMAIHGALLAPPDSPRPKVGYLVSIRSTQLHVARLDDIDADLYVEASCLARTTNNVLYMFKISAQGQLLLDGRAAVVLNIHAPSFSTLSTSGNII